MFHERLQALRTIVELRSNLVWGAYVAPSSSPYQHWPLFVGPIGDPDTTFGRPYRDAWRGARGFEISTFGRSVWVAHEPLSLGVI